MRIDSVEFVRSCYRVDDFPRDGLPEVAFVGRSNVGKSTLINTLTGRRKLAHTSSTPGKTRSINFYILNRRFYFVDLPGYGYARVSRAERKRWQALIDGYLRERAPLRLILALIDVRREPDELDMGLYEYLAHTGKPVVTVATKADKLSKSQLLKAVDRLKSLLPVDRVIAFSARSGQGRAELLRQIFSAVAG